MLDNFIGQSHIIEELRIAIASAKERKKPLGHCLFNGQPGLGKSTLARLIAEEMGGRLLEATASNVSRTKIEDTIFSIKYGDIVFISEIHNLKLQVAESLYNLLETWYYDGFLVPEFTMIIDTNYLGQVYKPLRERFIYQYEFKPYSADDLTKILELDGIHSEVAKQVALRSRGIPRVALRYLQKVKDRGLTVDNVKAMFAHSKIDTNGMTPDDRDVLLYLKSVGARDRSSAVGESSIYTTCGIEKDDYKNIIEPYLIREGLMARTNRGRILTHEGIRYVNGVNND